MQYLAHKHEEETGAFKSVGEETKIIDDDGCSFVHAQDHQEGQPGSEEGAEPIKHVNWFVRKYYPWLALTAGFIYGTQAFIQSYLLDENAQ